MTDRLYYEDAYLTKFTATVLETRQNDARLDRSAFYPTSGGQPFDTGTLGGRAVLDVYAENGEVWHKLDAPLETGARVTGEIDWNRRFDHMQQHGGEHLLAGEIYRHLGGMTIGLHLGRDESTIDCELPDGRARITDAELILLEDAVNARVQQDAPCRCYFPTPEELAALPLRKAPTVTEHVRVVAFGDFEMVACGGTHPSSTGQIGLVKILDARPSKGKVRFSFVCGMRAIKDYRARFEAAKAASALVSAPYDMLPEAVRRTLESEAALRSENMRLLREAAKRECETLLQADAPVIAHDFPGLPMDALREAANEAAAKGKIALFGATQKDVCLLAFACPEDKAIDLSALMRNSGAKGGGKNGFAQGSAPTSEALDKAMSLL